jgi:hypothetical protein
MAYHTVQLASTAKSIKVKMTGTGDADLYTQFTSKPTKSSYDCRPYKSGSSETCSHSTASGDTLEIMVFGYDSGSSTYSITVTWTE